MERHWHRSPNGNYPSWLTHVDQAPFPTKEQIERHSRSPHEADRIDSKRLRSAGFEEMLRIIREEEPPKPSTRISSWGASAKSVSDSRRSTMQSLKKMVQGDLDWIVMKAIEKDRARRYDSANAFASDVHSHVLTKIPIRSEAHSEPRDGYGQWASKPTSQLALVLTLPSTLSRNATRVLQHPHGCRDLRDRSSHVLLACSHRNW